MDTTSRVTRREFLARGAGAASLTAGLPYFISSRVLAAPGRPGANDRIRIGCIGCGRRSGQLQAALPRDGVIVAAADCNLPRAEAVAKRYGGKAFQDYRALLELPDVDAVIVASPDHWHALHTIHACQAGKDVYVEKPMSLTVREGRCMVEAARKHQRVVQVGSQQRSMAGNLGAIELVHSGKLGKISECVAANYPSPWECSLPEQPVPPGLDWDQWCGPTEVVPYNRDIYVPRAQPGWISFRPWSGGEMTGWGAHGLDQIQWALGMDASGPTEIWSEGPRFEPPTYSKPESRRRGEQVCRQPAVTFRYAQGAVVSLRDGDPGGGKIIGGSGSIHIYRGGYKILSGQLTTMPRTRSGGDSTATHLGNWLAAIRSRAVPNADVEIGHRTATVCHLCNIARWTGRKLRWNPARETFLDDDAANALLDRPRRARYAIPEST